tara:strand:- start:997 stop:1569 length:573 start_codon:yes stop_codon:yes gene_type:complete
MAKKHLWLSTLNDGVLDQYHTELYIAFLKDGSISLHPSTWCVEYPRFWDKARRGIKTPRQLIDAYNDIDEIDMDSFDDFELPRELFKLNPYFAVVTDWYLELDGAKSLERYRKLEAGEMSLSDYHNPQPPEDDDNEEEELLVFSLKYLSKNKIVLPDNFDDALKSFSLIFNSIKKYYDKNGKLPIRKLEH